VEKDKTPVMPSLITVLKGFILLLWIVFLVWATIFAASSSVSQSLLSFSRTMGWDKDDYGLYAQADTILDEFRLSPDRVEASLGDQQNRDENRKVLRDELQNIKKRVADYLLASANDLSVSPDSLRLTVNEFVHDDFILSSAELERQIELPPGVVDWIQRYRKDAASNLSTAKAKADLVDTFAILMALGAFGSIIFLVNDYVSPASSFNIQSYLFRPLFGMLLAAAVFIVDVATQAIVSKSEISDLRHETLYLLALAAGLLTEKVYAFVQNKLTDIVKSYKK
jgi:hypothetical protein